MTWPARQETEAGSQLSWDWSLRCACSSGGDSLRSEKIIDWDEYEVTGSHELTFTALAGDPNCSQLRILTKETEGHLEVATVEGVPPDAPKTCTAVGTIEKLTVSTEARAKDLEVHPMRQRKPKKIPSTPPFTSNSLCISRQHYLLPYSPQPYPQYASDGGITMDVDAWFEALPERVAQAAQSSLSP